MESESKESVFREQIFDSVSVPLLIGQPTLRVWIIGNPISGHGKGDEHLKSLRKAIQEQLVTCRLVDGHVTLEEVHVPLWKASEFYAFTDCSSSEKPDEKFPQLESHTFSNTSRGKIAAMLRRAFDILNTEEFCNPSFSKPYTRESVYATDRTSLFRGSGTEKSPTTAATKSSSPCSTHSLDSNKTITSNDPERPVKHEWTSKEAYPLDHRKISSLEKVRLPDMSPSSPGGSGSHSAPSLIGNEAVSSEPPPSLKQVPVTPSVPAEISTCENGASSVSKMSSDTEMILESSAQMNSPTAGSQQGRHSASSSWPITARICGGPGIHALMVYTEAEKDGYKLFERITHLIVQDRLNYTEQFLEATTSPFIPLCGSDNSAPEGLNSCFPLPQTMEDIPYPFRDIMVIVGGDGTLSEGINGICHGVRQGYSLWLQDQSFDPSYRNCCERIISGCAIVSQPEIAQFSTPQSFILHNIVKLVQGSLDSISTSEDVLQEKRIIECLAPYVLYSPSGTGADFAKLGVCCTGTADFVNVVKDFSRAFFYSYTSSHVLSSERSALKSSFSSSRGGKEQNLPSPGITPVYSTEWSSETMLCQKNIKKGLSDEKKTKKTTWTTEYVGNFTSIAVDVGRINFPKTGRVHYFINECSMGMSVEVIQRTNRFRKISLLTALGGTIIFGSASFVSLVKMAPLWVRIMRLPPRMHPSFPCCDFYCSANKVDRSKKALVINPLYQYHPDMWDALDAAQQKILLESGDSAEDQQIEKTGGQRLSEIDPWLSKKRTMTTTSVQHLICYGKQSAREELDWKEYDNCEKLEKMPHHCAACTPISHLERPRWVYLFSSTVAFGNGRWYGGGMQVTPHGDPTDHLLSVTKWRTSFWQFTSGIRGLYNGDHPSWSSTDTFDGSRFLLDAGPRDPHCIAESANTSSGQSDGENDAVDVDRGASTLLLEADGELLETLPACIEVGPSIMMLSSRGSLGDGNAQFNFGRPIPGTRRFMKEQEQKGISPSENSS